MEVALGQFSQLGPLAVWKLSPIGRGIGFAMCTLSLIVAIYYNVIMGYCLHYIYFSFFPKLPWASCTDDRWAADITTQVYNHFVLMSEQLILVLIALYFYHGVSSNFIFYSFQSYISHKILVGLNNTFNKTFISFVNSIQYIMIFVCLVGLLLIFCFY